MIKNSTHYALPIASSDGTYVAFVSSINDSDITLHHGSNRLGEVYITIRYTKTKSNVE